MKKLFIVSALVLLTATYTYAAGHTVSEDCGCGLGRVLIGEKQGLVWNIAGTSLNGTSGNNTFGMSSGTLGCDTGGVIVMNEKIKIFVADNMDNLAFDIAAGKGETIDALAEVAMISNDKKTVFFKTLQSHFDTIFPNGDANYAHVSGTIADIAKNI